MAGPNIAGIGNGGQPAGGGAGGGVTSIIAGAGISVNQATGAVTVTNTASSSGSTITVTIVTANSNLADLSYTVVNTGNATTQTLPASPPTNAVIVVKNRGSGAVTVGASSTLIFTNAATGTYLLGGTGACGTAATFTWDGTFWNVS